MTYQQTLWAIDEAAELAAASAFDAFSDDPAAGFPTPEVAWEHLNGAIYGDGEVERPAALPHFLPNQFRDDYRRHLRTLAEKRSAIEA